MTAFSAHAQTSRIIHYATGTAFFVSPDGDAVTAAHVLQTCKAITLKGSGLTATAQLVARDDAHDLALLHADISPLAVAALRAENVPPQPGETIVTVGFPGEQGLTTREGRLKAAQGPLAEPDLLLFTDASTHGNSGGPLLDSGANVIGVVQAKAQVTTRYTLNGRFEKETKEASDVAIALAPLRALLKNHNIRYRESAGQGQLSPHRIEDRAREFVTRVWCEQ